MTSPAEHAWIKATLLCCSTLDNCRKWIAGQDEPLGHAIDEALNALGEAYLKLLLHFAVLEAARLERSGGDADASLPGPEGGRTSGCVPGNTEASA